MIHMSRALQLILIVVFSFSVVGFFIGIRENDKPKRYHQPSDQSPNQANQAVSYSEMEQASFHSNAQWQNHIKDLSPNNSITSKTLATTERRAYAGAPPTIPHPITQQSSSSCLVCHENGKKIAGNVASKISHAHYTSCTQCHVPAENKFFSNFKTFANHFEGLEETKHGTRASIIAPPTMPHSQWMRQDCLSCHGPLGNRALKSTHPERRNCLQCHAPNAEKDQR